jgi:hypothetical protein
VSPRSPSTLAGGCPRCESPTSRSRLGSMTAVPAPTWPISSPSASSSITVGIAVCSAAGRSRDRMGTKFGQFAGDSGASRTARVVPYRCLPARSFAIRLQSEGAKAWAEPGRAYSSPGSMAIAAGCGYVGVVGAGLSACSRGAIWICRRPVYASKRREPILGRQVWGAGRQSAAHLHPRESGTPRGFHPITPASRGVGERLPGRRWDDRESS